MSKKNREQLRDEFQFAIPGTRVELSEIDSAQSNNLSLFSTKLGYISAAVIGGKMTAEDAEKRVKDLYKVWKQSNKSLEDGLR